MSNVFIAFQKNEESRAIVNAILADNPGAIVSDQPAMVKIDVPGHLVVIRRASEEEIGPRSTCRKCRCNLITL